MAPPSLSADLRSGSGSRKRLKLQDESLIKDLEDELTESISSNASLNPLADLTSLATSLDEPQIVLKAIYACYRVFTTLISNGSLETSTNEQAKVVQIWILGRLDEYIRFLCGLIKDEEPLLRTSALNIVMSLLKHLSASLSRSSPQAQFHVPHFKKVISALLRCPPLSRSTQEEFPGELDPEVRDMFIAKWLNVYTDVRWFFLRDAEPILLSSSLKTDPQVPKNLLSFLERLKSFPIVQSELTSWWVEGLKTQPAKPNNAFNDSEPDLSGSGSEPEANEGDWRKFFDEEEMQKRQSETPIRLHRLTVHQSLHSLASHRAVFTRLWLRLLPRLSGDERAGSSLSLRVLNIMHRGVMPHLTRAVMVMDWVGGCVDYGGVVGLLALNTLFILMQEYNLDYPSFYTRLYAFLDQDLLHLKYRSRFFRLTELFLSSTHLPATLLASFVKRLSRLSLTAPPSSIVITIPFIYNILKRHPALMRMIHRDEDGSVPFEDPFVTDEPNPNLTNALDSSLWELCSHKSHYHAGVSTLARIFEEAFTKPSYPLEDFLDHTYGTLIEGELKRRIKKDPSVEINEPHGIFETRDDPPLDSERNIVECLWTF
ncbi:CBF/Mak21 family-domain-containing protein [Multifurca ochricompacta]|uniref:CBF/Mak21 family-domain-containing protein n=1 Tax=Multifurca ochricompacta TaxID=376703 RepID=A0AAD4M3B8_9AGAM|nr:CBF/Mak21 family-domain-containing protein [Multifurca ochricompacta]